MPTFQRGRFIVLEGLDRSGKSTQVERVAEWIRHQGFPAQVARFPDRTTAIGQMIDAYLTSASNHSDQTIHLLFAANRWERAQEIQRALARGTWVVCDRYAFSGVAFTAAKGLDFDWCKAPDAGLLTPDVVFFLDVPSRIAEQRGGYGAERYEKREFQNKVREQFATMTQRLPSQLWHVVDASPSLDDVTESLTTQLKEVIQAEAKPLAWDLWQ